MGRGSSPLPGASGEQHQNREDLKTAGQHIQNQNQLGKRAVDGKIAGGTHGFQAGADVVEAGENSRKVRLNGKAVQRDDHEANEHNDHISSKVGVAIAENLLADRLIVVPDDLNLLGMQNLLNVSAEAFHQQQQSGAFQTAAGGTGTGAHNHQAQ